MFYRYNSSKKCSKRLNLFVMEQFCIILNFLTKALRLRFLVNSPGKNNSDIKRFDPVFKQGKTEDYG